MNNLRIIQLIEADYNAMLKIKINRIFMNKCENNNEWNDGVFGGRKNRSTWDALLTQILICDVCRQTNTDFTIASIDATKCYDKMFANVGSVAIQAMGIPQEFSQFIAKVTKQTSHSVKTAFRISISKIKQKNERTLVWCRTRL